jgi:hypothetical protein
MFKKTLLILLLLAGRLVFAQGNQFPNAATSGSGAPTGACGNGSLYTDTATGNLYTCLGGTWTANPHAINATNATNATKATNLAGGTLLNGSGAPTGACGNGSLYTDNSTGLVYPCKSAAWVAPVSAPSAVIPVDGLRYSTLAAAFAACPSAGCTIDMRGCSTCTTLGTFDPGGKAVVILLGPYTYAVTQITVRTSLQIIGMGPGGGTPLIGTGITQANASIAPFVLGGGLYPANVAINVYLANFNLDAAAGSTTDGLSFVAITSTDTHTYGGGLWYSALYNLTIGAVTPFGRNAIRFDDTARAMTGAAMQFNSMRNVTAYRALNGLPALMIIGDYNGQLTVDDSEFDGQYGQTDTANNIYNIQIGNGDAGNAGFWIAYSIVMRNVTSQWAGDANNTGTGTGSAAIFLAGGVAGFTCQGCHFEGNIGTIKEVVSPGGKGNWGVVISDSYVVGMQGANGYLSNTDVNSSLALYDNAMQQSTSGLLGDTTYVTYRNNLNVVSGGWMTGLH